MHHKKLKLRTRMVFGGRRLDEEKKTDKERISLNKKLPSFLYQFLSDLDVFSLFFIPVP